SSGTRTETGCCSSPLSNAKRAACGSSVPVWRRAGNAKIMKKTKASEAGSEESDDLRPEYRFDYSKARPNRFAGQEQRRAVVVALDPDVSEVFSSAEAVNDVLRALIAAWPKVPVRS